MSKTSKASWLSERALLMVDSDYFMNSDILDHQHLSPKYLTQFILDCGSFNLVGEVYKRLSEIKANWSEQLACFESFFLFSFFSETNNTILITLNVDFMYIFTVNRHNLFLHHLILLFPSVPNIRHPL